MRDRELLIKEIKKIVSGYASTSVGERKVVSIKSDYTVAERDFRLIMDVLREYEYGHSLTFPVFPPMDEVFGYFEKFGVLSAEKLYMLSDFVDKVIRLRESIHSTNLAYYLNIPPEIVKFSNEIKRSISRDGTIKASKRPLLKELYEKRNKLRQELLNRFAAIINEHSDKLREGQPVIKNGRLTLPVISNYSVEGVVHGYSYTTETVFVEPYEVIPLQNQVIKIDDRIRDEERKILGNLINTFISNAGKIKDIYENLGFVDSIYSRARFYLDFKCCIPEFSRGKGLEILEGRELLLYSKIKEKTVPLSVKPKSRVFLITGPNAGGKTVALRNIAGVILMASMGIPVPAKKAVIPYGSRVFMSGFYDEVGGSEFSHFTRELMNVKEFLDRAKSGDVVILDEVFSSTDPDEASSLAYAVSEYLYNKGVYVFISTHFPALKILISSNDNFEVATLENYKLAPGRTGESGGIQMAEVVGIPENVIETARNIYSTLPSYMAKLKDEYSRKIRKIERELEDIRRLKVELQNAIHSAKRGEIKKKFYELVREDKKEGVEVGKEYFVKSLGIKGKVVGIRGNKVKIKVRNLEIEVSINDIV